jgi:hypothetical protein
LAKVSRCGLRCDWLRRGQWLAEGLGRLAKRLLRRTRGRLTKLRLWSLLRWRYLETRSGRGLLLICRCLTSWRSPGLALRCRRLLLILGLWIALLWLGLLLLWLLLLWLLLLWRLLLQRRRSLRASSTGCAIS